MVPEVAFWGFWGLVCGLRILIRAPEMTFSVPPRWENGLDCGANKQEDTKRSVDKGKSQDLLKYSKLKRFIFFPF